MQTRERMWERMLSALPEVSWEQRGKLAADILFEAEICFRTALDAQDMSIHGMSIIPALIQGRLRCCPKRRQDPSGS